MSAERDNLFYLNLYICSVEIIPEFIIPFLLDSKGNFSSIYLNYWTSMWDRLHPKSHWLHWLNKHWCLFGDGKTISDRDIRGIRASFFYYFFFFFFSRPGYLRGLGDAAPPVSVPPLLRGRGEGATRRGRSWGTARLGSGQPGPPSRAAGPGPRPAPHKEQMGLLAPNARRLPALWKSGGGVLLLSLHPPS